MRYYLFDGDLFGKHSFDKLYSIFLANDAVFLLQQTVTLRCAVTIFTITDT